MAPIIHRTRPKKKRTEFHKGTSESDKLDKTYKYSLFHLFPNPLSEKYFELNRFWEQWWKRIQWYCFRVYHFVTRLLEISTLYVVYNQTKFVGHTGYNFNIRYLVCCILCILPRVPLVYKNWTLPYTHCGVPVPVPPGSCRPYFHKQYNDQVCSFVFIRRRTYTS